jgi:hypothetical protein
VVLAPQCFSRIMVDLRKECGEGSSPFRTEMGRVPRLPIILWLERSRAGLQAWRRNRRFLHTKRRACESSCRSRKERCASQSGQLRRPSAARLRFCARNNGSLVACELRTAAGKMSSCDGRGVCKGRLLASDAIAEACVALMNLM